MSELIEKAQEDLNKIIESCKDKELQPKLKEAIDLLSKHSGALEEASETIAESEQEQYEKEKSKELKSKGAKFVVFVDGKHASFGEMTMAKFIKFANEIGEEGLAQFDSGKISLNLFTALTLMYDELLIEELSDKVFHEDGEYTAQAVMSIVDHVSINKKKVTRY